MLGFITKHNTLYLFKKLKCINKNYLFIKQILKYKLFLR